MLLDLLVLKHDDLLLATLLSTVALDGRPRLCITSLGLEHFRLALDRGMILLRDELLKAARDTWLLRISLVTRSSLVTSLSRCVL